jgi:hypothetical protein
MILQNQPPSESEPAPRAQTKARKMIVRKIRKEAGPSSTDQEAPSVNQVRIVPLELVL